MNRLDVVLAIVLALFVARGFWRGFSREFFGFLGLIGGLVVAAATYVAAVPWVPDVVPTALRPIAAFAAIFFAVDLVANLLGLVVHATFGVLLLSPVDRLVGALFGGAKGAAMATIALLLAQAYVPSPGLSRQLESSVLARPLLGLAEMASDGARPEDAATGGPAGAGAAPSPAEAG